MYLKCQEIEIYDSRRTYICYENFQTPVNPEFEKLHPHYKEIHRYFKNILKQKIANIIFWINKKMEGVINPLPQRK